MKTKAVTIQGFVNPEGIKNWDSMVDITFSKQQFPLLVRATIEVELPQKSVTITEEEFDAAHVALKKENYPNGFLRVEDLKAIIFKDAK